MQEYSKAQQEDIESRVKKAELYLKGMNLFPSAVVQKINIGDDTFADKVICYLADSLYKPVKSPYNEPKKEN